MSVRAGGPVFDIGQTIKRQPARDYLETDEDVALTVWVTSLWEELRSPDEAPVPPCPHCASWRAGLLSRTGPRNPLPMFQCSDCGKIYTRMSGSPLQRLRHPHKTPDFIRLLSLPLPLEEAGRRMHMHYTAVSNWLMRFRELIVRNDPDGVWLPRVKLGLRYRPVGTCERCGYHGPLHYGGFAPGRRRRVICPACTRTWMLADALDHCMEARLTHDPALTAARRTRKAGYPALELPAPEQGVLKVAARVQSPSRVVVAASLPKQRRRRGAGWCDESVLLAAAEDPVLTAFLAAHIERVLSDEQQAPTCPHCGSVSTRLYRLSREPGQLPHFICRDCGRRYMRTTGTALERADSPTVVVELVPWLSRKATFGAAAYALGITPEIVSRRVRRFSQWLLELDPTGAMEARVRIGRRRY